MTNLSKLMQQAQKLQAKIGQLQEELAEKKVSATSGGGMVTAVCDGQQNLVEITIDPQVVDPEEVQMLEDLVVAAVNEARRKAQELATEEMSKLTGGINPMGLLDMGSQG
jgi:DNA-binding YbaB/EbfC family protein